MPSIFYVSPTGVANDLGAAVGTSVMQAAVDRRIPGILGECGGNCMCATCHVYVRQEFLSRLPAIKPNESAMLEIAAEPRKPNSRLSCQIIVDDALNGLIVDIPKKQR